MGGEGGIVSAAMLHMKDHADIQNSRLQRRVGAVRTQNMQDVFSQDVYKRQLLELDYVTSVISYANSVGNSIPSDFVPSDTLSALYSANYSRFILTLDTEERETGWNDKVNAVRNIGEKYYGNEMQ